MKGKDPGCIVIAPQHIRNQCLLCKQVADRGKRAPAVIKSKRMFNLSFDLFSTAVGHF